MRSSDLPAMTLTPEILREARERAHNMRVLTAIATTLALQVQELGIPDDEALDIIQRALRDT